MLRRNFCSRRAVLALLLSLVFFCISAGFFAVQPSHAFGLTSERFTARANASNHQVAGGIPTRVTWEGLVGEDEELTTITLLFDREVDLKDVVAHPVILQGLERLPIEVASAEVGEIMPADASALGAVRAVTAGISDAQPTLTLTFSEPLPQNARLRLELQDVVFPTHGGDFGLEVVGKDVQGNAGQAVEVAQQITVTSTSNLDKTIAWLDEQPWVAAWNSNQFLSMFFKPQLIVKSAVELFGGWIRVLGLVALGFPIAVPLALVLAFMKMSRIRIARILASLYINVIRGTPIFLQIYIAFFGLPLLGIDIDNFILGFGVMAINSAAYMAEIFRAGIESIPRGQFEAAASLGMNKWQSMFHVILPQTIRRVIPTMTSEFIMMYKDTSLLSSVGVMELMMFSKNITAATGNITPYIVAAGYYLLVTIPLTKFVNLFEQRLAKQEMGGFGGQIKDDEKEEQVQSSAGANGQIGVSHAAN